MFEGEQGREGKKKAKLHIHRNRSRAPSPRTTRLPINLLVGLLQALAHRERECRGGRVPPNGTCLPLLGPCTVSAT